MLPRWVLLALASAIGYGMSTVATTAATGKHGISSMAMTSCYHITATIMFAVTLLIPLPYGLSKNAGRDLRSALTTRLPIAIVIAILFWAGDVALNTAYPIASNPGYCDSVSDIESVLGALIALAVFAAPISRKQALGMVLAVFSLHFLQS